MKTKLLNNEKTKANIIIMLYLEKHRKVCTEGQRSLLGSKGPKGSVRWKG